MRFKNTEVNLELSKRQKIILSSIFFTLGFLFITQISNIVLGRYQYLVLIFALSAYLLSLWSIWRGMTKLKALMVFILPFAYTVLVPSFYLLVREIRWLTRLPVAIFFGLGFYCLLLTQNVFNVAADRNIPLYRAASAVNFIYTIILGMFLYSLVFTLNLSFFWNGIIIFVTSFPLILQMLWAVRIENLNTQIIIYTSIASLVLSECAIALSFWGSSPFVRALLLAVIGYVVLGIILDFMHERLSSRVAWEYLTVGGVVCVFIFTLTYLFIQ